MFIYAETQYTVARTGSAVKQVRCERCGCNYSYEAIRRTMGIGHSPFSLRNRAAQAEATKIAEQRLARRLARAVDPVGCPDCGWFQAGMVKEMRRRDQRWMVLTGIIGAGTLWVSALMGLLCATEGLRAPLEGDSLMEVIGLAGAGAAFALLFLGARWVLGWRIDPNRTGGQKPARIPGAPPAIKTGEQPATLWGFALPVEASWRGLQYETLPPALERGGWVTIQLAKFRCPQQCCVCLNQTQVMRSYRCGRMAAVSLPVCDQCDRKFRWKRGLGFLQAAVLGGSLGLIGGMLVPAGGAMAMVPMTVSGVLTGILLGIPFTNRVARPATIGTFRSELNTVRLRFRNLDYLNSYGGAVRLN